MSLITYCLKSGVLSAVIYLNIFDFAQGLTGHVCSRQKAETYETTYDRAFICPERYTTACGQLDWRRCTKYRVNTCYTPTQKYAIRYYTVEECCPGWKDAGGGACTIPVCLDGCENGGRCSVTTNGIPGCSCPENYYGSRCQYGRHTIQKILLIIAVSLAVCTIFAVMFLFYCRHSNKRTNIQELVHLKTLNSIETEQLLSDTDKGIENEVIKSERGKVPTAPAVD